MSTFSSKVFFDALSAHFGALSQDQKVGFARILQAAARRGTAWDFLAYILATTWWETGKTMEPVREAFWVKNAEAWRKAHLRYYPYYGRGYVQLTWLRNYQLVTDYFRNVLHIEVDFVKNPDLVMHPEYALIILFVGMEKGWFTGKSLSDYLDGIDEADAEDLREFANARRIINGTDKAATIGAIAVKMEHALRKAGYGPTPEPVRPTPKWQGQPTPSTPENAVWQAIVAFLVRFGAALLTSMKGKHKDGKP